MLRTTILYLHDRTKVVLSGQLVGEGADCLRRSVGTKSPAAEGIEIDLDGLTCIDHAGEEALLSLWQARGRFICTSPFARALCERLGIPVNEDAR